MSLSDIKPQPSSSSASTPSLPAPASTPLQHLAQLVLQLQARASALVPEAMQQRPCSS